MSLEYKGYAAGPIEFDKDARLFSGVVAGLRDVIRFSSHTAEELAQAFKDSIDDYLAFCEERGAAPEPPPDRRVATVPREAGARSRRR